MKRAALILAGLLALVSCSTTRVLQDGQYRLSANKVEIKGDRKLNASEVTSYIRQQPNSSVLFGWNPFLSVYNWSNGSGKGINGVWEKIGTAPVVFSESQVESSIENVKSHLAYLGYYNAKVSAKVEKNGKIAKVRYSVDTGSRYPIDEIVYDVPGGEFGQAFNADSLNRSVKVGDWLSESSLETESIRGAGYFRNLGYYSFNKNNYFFEADTLGEKNILYYRIRGYTRNESETSDGQIPRYKISEVSIHHPADIPFRESLLKKFTTIRPGDWYSEDIVNTTYYRLSALKVFNNVSVEMTPVDSSDVSCDIRLSGSSLQGFKVNLEASSNSSGLLGISPQLNFFHKNIFRGGEWLNLGFTGNWQFKPNSDVSSTELGVSASLSFPHLLGYPLSRAKGKNIPRTEVKTSINYQNRPEYRRSIASLSYGYIGQIGSNVSFQVYPMQFNLAKLYDISDTFAYTLVENPYLWDSFEDHVDIGMGGVLYHTTDSDIVPKTAYRFARLTFDTSGNLLSLFDRYLAEVEGYNEHKIFGLPYNQYVRAELSLGQVFRFGKNYGHALAFHVDAGLGKAYGNSQALPFEKQFYCGGASSMRGWQVRTLGPGYEEPNEFFIIPSQTGDLKFEADIEYRFPMFWKLEGALFGEAGNVWNIRDNNYNSPQSLAADWGLGVRVNLDFILLRVDAGFKLHDPSKPEGERWRDPSRWLKSDGFAVHFGVGYPF